MGTAHLNPHGTRTRYSEVVTYKRQHISVLNRPDSNIEATENEDFVVSRMCTEYDGFERVTGGCDWIHNGRGVDEKVIAETRHGVELRVKYHPAGSKYYFLVVTSGEFCQENLAVQHLEGYNETLREILEGIYGEVHRKTGRWTSTKVTEDGN